MRDQSFLPILSRLHDGLLDSGVRAIERATAEDVQRALTHIPVSPEGLCALLSRSADTLTDTIETAARNLTAQRFGRVVNLYIPLYLTNSCVNNCGYCGFGKDQPIPRKTLSLDELKKEGERLLAEGYKSLLLVAGEDQRVVSVDYLASAIRLMKKIGFVFISVEVGPLSVEGYRTLGNAGLDGVTIYQESYDRAIYDAVHLSGPKKNFDYRIETPERVAAAGIRVVGLGFLLGLADFRREALTLSAHVKYLRKKYWQSSIAISFPRIHTTPSGFTPAAPVADNELVRLIMALRLANPDAILTLSTREAPALRNRLFGVGINQVSAGSKTSPGSYAGEGAENGEQFPVVDDRTPQQVIAAIRERGFEWVFKDWDENLKPVSL